MKNGTAGCVKEIIRCKNGWSVYNEQLPSYTDIKLNVLLQSEDGKSIIAEIQLLLDVMSAYKKVAHKLYSVERKFELVANYQLMADKMAEFEDLNETAARTAIRFIQNDDIIGFEAFELCFPSTFDELISQNISNFFELWEKDTIKLLKYISICKRMTDGKKCKALVYLMNVCIPSNFNETLSALQQTIKNEKLLNSFAVIFDIWKNQFIHQRFSCFTLRAPNTDNSIYKFTKYQSRMLYTQGKDIDHFFENAGALGLGQSIGQTKKLKFVGLFNQFYAADRCMAIDARNNCFAWGNHEYVPTFFDIFGQKVIKIALGAKHTLILTANNLVYSFGQNKFNQLGLSEYTTDDTVYDPTLIATVSHIQIVHISAGAAHSMLVSKDGKLLAFGHTADGRCGTKSNFATPAMIDMPNSTFVKSAECGGYHSIIFNDEGQIFGCGDKKYAGVQHTAYNIFEPRPIQALESDVITSVAVGTKHSLCLNEKREVWSWGEGRFGALGHNNSKTKAIPERIEYFAKNKIEIGSVYANYHQSAAISADNKALYVWGDFDKTVGGKKMVPNKFAPFEDFDIVSVGLGETFIGILCESKEEFKEIEIVLKGGEEITVENDMSDVKNKQEHNVYIQNEELFGDDDWIQIAANGKYLPFPYFGHKFVENLVMNKDKTLIELIKYSEIEKIYQSDIIGATFFLSFDALNKTVITTKQSKKFKKKSQKYAFEKIEDIAFNIPQTKEYQENVSIYVQPKAAKSIFFLKQINL